MTKLIQSLVPPYVPAAVLTVIVSIASDKLKWRGPFMLLFLPITIVGTYVTGSKRQGISI